MYINTYTYVVFQNYVLVKDKLGITKVCDLCSSDMQRVRTLALIELTALFDIYDITYGKRKNRKKLKGKKKHISRKIGKS